MLEKMAANRERLVLLASSVLTTATLLLLVVVIPLAAVHVQKRNTQLLSNVYDCQVSWGESMHRCLLTPFGSDRIPHVVEAGDPMGQSEAAATETILFRVLLFVCFNHQELSLTDGFQAAVAKDRPGSL